MQAVEASYPGWKAIISAGAPPPGQMPPGSPSSGYFSRIVFLGPVTGPCENEILYLSFGKAICPLRCNVLLKGTERPLGEGGCLVPSRFGGKVLEGGELGLV